HSWGGSIGVQLAADHPERVDALVLLDAGYSDVDELPAATREELAEQFEREQEAFAFDTWDEFLETVRSRRSNWRPALEERYRAGMVEREGKIVPRSPARAAAWALYGAATEKQTATHGRLHLPILLLLAADADAGAFADKPNVE